MFKAKDHLSMTNSCRYKIGSDVKYVHYVNIRRWKKIEEDGEDTQVFFKKRIER